jgi:hypothetical protein
MRVHSSYFFSISCKTSWLCSKFGNGFMVLISCPSLFLIWVIHFSRVAAALRIAALAVHNSKTALGAFYRRISRRKGASEGVYATARKLAQIIYRLVCHGQAYIDVGAKAYEAQFNNRRLKYYTKALKDMGYKIKPLA